MLVNREISEGVKISIEIILENIFVDCLGCGREIQIDIDSIGNGKAEDAFCGSCQQKLFAVKRYRKHWHKKNLRSVEYEDRAFTGYRY